MYDHNYKPFNIDCCQVKFKFQVKPLCLNDLMTFPENKNELPRSDYHNL